MNDTTTVTALPKFAPKGIIRDDSRIHGKGQTVRIFLVDDNPDFLLVAKRFLGLNPRFEVVGTATSGRLALDQMDQVKPDLVIMDLVMPEMSGIEAARLIKAQASSIRLILTSFQEGPEYQRSAEAVGADAFLSKSGFGEHVNKFIDILFTPPRAA